MKYRLKIIWDLRAKLDRAILSKNYDDIIEIRNDYMYMMDNEDYKSDDFINGDFPYESQRNINYHTNVNVILGNIEDYWAKYKYKGNVSTKLKKGDFLAGQIWILRAMYDKFLSDNTQDNELLKQQNMILGKVIIDELNFLKNSKTNSDIEIMIKEVEDGYKNKYGNAKPKTEYYQLCEEYLEE